MRDDELILLESMISRLDEMISDMEQDQGDVYHQAQEYTLLLREELITILNSSQ